MKKNILFDLTATQPSLEANFHGGSEYAKFVFHEAIQQNEKYFDCIYNPDFLLDVKIKNICSENDIKLHEVSSLKDISKLIKNYKYTVFYSALPYLYGELKIFPCKFIMTIHGLRELECPSDRTQVKYCSGFISILKFKIKKILFKNKQKKTNFNKFKTLLNVKNNKIITVSEHSKYSILSFFPKLIANEIKVIHAPIKLFKSEKYIEYKFEDIKKEYFLLISGNRWIKNNYRAIQAFDQLFNQGKLKGKKVIVVGVKNNTKLQNVNNKNSFIFLDYVEEGEFSWLFENAFCFVYPSLNEGFGYPPLNAMNFNVPTIASAVSSITEVCSNAVLYFNPLSIDEIKNRILQINDNLSLYKDLQRKGQDRLTTLMARQEYEKKEIIKVIFENNKI